MANIRINDQNYEAPDNGEKNWGDKVIAILNALASNISNIFSLMARKGENNVFTANNTFNNVPQVTEGDSQVNIATISDIESRSGALQSELSDDIVENTAGITGINERIGATTTGEFYDTLGLETLSGADGIVTQSSEATVLKSLQSVLAQIKEQEKIHTPIGSLKYLDVRSPTVPTPIWRQVRNADDTFYPSTGDRPNLNAYWFNASFISDGVTQHSWVDASPFGGDAWFEFVESDSNLWAFCDGTFPLPPSHFGTNGTWTEAELGAGHHGIGTPKLHFIKNCTGGKILAGVSATQTETTASGNNTLQITRAQLPNESPNITTNTPIELIDPSLRSIHGSTIPFLNTTTDENEEFIPPYVTVKRDNYPNSWSTKYGNTYPILATSILGDSAPDNPETQITTLESYTGYQTLPNLNEETSLFPFSTSNTYGGSTPIRVTEVGQTNDVSQGTWSQATIYPIGAFVTYQGEKWEKVTDNFPDNFRPAETNSDWIRAELQNRNFAPTSTIEPLGSGQEINLLDKLNNQAVHIFMRVQ